MEEYIKYKQITHFIYNLKYLFYNLSNCTSHNLSRITTSLCMWDKINLILSNFKEDCMISLGNGPSKCNLGSTTKSPPPSKWYVIEGFTTLLGILR